MTNYKTIQKTCREQSGISRAVVDDFLISYAAGRENLEREMSKRLALYRHITREFPEGGINLLKSQYIAHKIFRNGGLIKRYLNHSALNHLSESERTYLEYQAENPWRFSFSVVTGNPAEHFFEMEDVFTGDSFLLYSPGITGILQKHAVTLWFNLLGFNGACWQSFGPIGAYQSFEAGDIFFFASELHPRKWFETGEEVMESVKKNPLPYMLLLSGAAYPQSFHRKDQIVQITAEYFDDSFDPSGFGKHFKTEYSDGVYRLSLKKWSDFPHYTAAYYEEKDKILFLCSMTDRGFDNLVHCLNGYGYDLSRVPDFRVNMSMITTVEKFLKRELTLNRYESLFSPETSDEENKELEKLNLLMTMLLPEMNSGRKPDIEAMARKAGVDVETARDIVRNLMEKTEKTKK